MPINLIAAGLLPLSTSLQLLPSQQQVKQRGHMARVNARKRGVRVHIAMKKHEGAEVQLRPY
jgi:hypothetical protein